MFTAVLLFLTIIAIILMARTWIAPVPSHVTHMLIPYLDNLKLIEILATNNCARICSFLRSIIPNSLIYVYRNNQLLCSCGNFKNVFTNCGFLYVKTFNNNTYMIEIWS